ncbi:MAG: DUF2723 domain-containing protein [Bacteroidota bacterium]|nr:DUF2723 domain-containing protein [Bacteroidota bacterium]
MKNFRSLNNMLGWLSFLIASIVYLSTIEPTASLWDCGEYIATAFKLQVGHPPGAPLFLLLGRVAALFAGSDLSNAAKMVNALSALASAFTIMFLYWTIAHLAKKMVSTDGSLNSGQAITVVSSGLIGAFAFMFSDTFWFSAGEGEVYATSSLFTAMVFWAILKWENVANEKHSDRWIILIAYLMGLSIGIHLLNLLAIPAIIFVYYFKKFDKIDLRGIAITTVISFVVLAVVMYGIILGVFQVSAKAELFFVNSLGLPYNSGFLFHMFLLIALLILGIYFSQVKNDPIKTTIVGSLALILAGVPFMTSSVFFSLILIGGLVWLVYYLAHNNIVALNTIFLAISMILIGYSSFTLIVIRSHAEPPINENDPSNVFSLLSYINREQYGDRPLAKGQHYNAPAEAVLEGKASYMPKDGKYVISKRKQEVVYDSRFVTVFPRMWSSQAGHEQVYKQWAGNSGRQVTIGSGENARSLKVPTFAENIRFFVTYQIGFMYGRYFMWNFAGRQNDIQGAGGPLKGNWLSGINFIDQMRLGPQKDLPDYLANNKGRNKYYMLPFILGMLGLLFQVQKNPKDFWVVFLLFILTGLAIVVYLNQYPNQPRERDYAYVGSFYAFAIWIGLGMVTVVEGLKKIIPEKFGAPLAGVVLLALVPGIMGMENWDDHDRSGRYTARDIAFNYLNSCEPNSIIVTNGDNDTFPLWYAQEVEGIRTDVRVVNTMLFNTEWYIDQMKKKAYDSEALPLSMQREKYLDGVNGQVYILERVKGPQDLKMVLDFVADENPNTKLRVQNGEMIDYFPSRTLRLPFDSSKFTENTPIVLGNVEKPLSEIEINLKGNYLLKSQMMMLDLLATNNWERPVYFVAGGHADALGLEPYFLQEGFANRIVPLRTDNERAFEYGRINTDAMYKNYMENFRWGRMNEPDVYLDYYTRRTISVIRMRSNFARLAVTLVEEGKKDSAIAVVDRCFELLPQDRMRFDLYTTRLIEAYYKAGEIEKANEKAESFYAQLEKQLNYYFSLRPEIGKATDLERRMDLQALQDLSMVTGEFKQMELNAMLQQALDKYYQLFISSTAPGR